MPKRSTPQAVHFSIPMLGWLFILVTLAVAGGAVQTGATFLFILAGAMAGAMIASFLMSRAMVKSIQFRREVTDRAWQNETVHLAYYLRNTGWRGSCLGITIDEIAPEGIHSASGYCVHLPARQLFRSGARFVSYRRGRIELRCTRVSTSFPFGLLKASRLVDHDSSIVVWPAKGRLRRELLRRGAAATSTAAPSPVSGGQDEFFGLREYRTDDNPRWIHWRKSAGRQSPVIREMARPLPEELMIVLDSFCGDTSATALAYRERMLRMAATLIEHAMVVGYQVGLAVNYTHATLVLPPQAGLGQRCKLLDALADVDDNRTRPLEQCLQALEPKALRNAQVVALTAGLTRQQEDMLRAIKGSCRQLSVIDPNRLAQVFEDAPAAAAKSAASASDDLAAPGATRAKEAANAS